MYRTRNPFRSFLSFCTLCFTTGMLAPTAQAQRVYPYIIEDLGSVSPDGTGDGFPYTSYAYGINNLGQVVTIFGAHDVPAHLGVYKDGIGMVDLGAPGDDRNGLLPVGINDAGQIGLTLNFEFLPHAYLYDPHQGYLDGQIDVAVGMNQAGNIVGGGIYPNGAGAAFENLFIGGAVNLDFPYFNQSPRIWQLLTAYAISDDETIVGRGFHNQLDCAYIWQSGEPTELGSLGGGNTVPYGVNTSHQVVGSSSAGPEYNYANHAFLWQNSVMQDLGLLPGIGAMVAKHINNRGEVIGIAQGDHDTLFYYAPGGGLRAFEDLIDPAEHWYFNTVFSDVGGINDRGQICGYATHYPNGFDGSAYTHAFRMTPRTALGADSSAQVTVKRAVFRFDRASGHYMQAITLTNASASTLTGPFSVAIDSLVSNVTLVHGAGSTHFLSPANSPYVTATATTLAPGASVTLNLEFANPASKSITYNTRVLSGNGLF